MPAKTPEAIARKRANDVEARRRRARKLRENGEYLDREMARSQKRFHKDAFIQRVNMVAMDGEADENAQYVQLAALSHNKNYPLERLRALTLTDTIPYLKRIQHSEKKYAENRTFNDTVFVMYYYGYDWDKLLFADPNITEETKLAIAGQTKRSYGSIRTPGWRNEIDVPSMGLSIYKGKKKIKIHYWKRDENGAYIFDENGVPEYAGYSTTIWDTASLANKAFAKVCRECLDAMDVTSADYTYYKEQYELIVEGKAARGDWVGFNADKRREYNHAELVWILYWIEGIRNACLELGLSPHELNSPAALTRAGYTKYKVKRHIQPEWYASNEFQESEEFLFIRRAQFAGRIEQAVQGFLDTLHSYDINSAYPAQTRKLPCCAHGHYEWLTALELQAASHGILDEWAAYEVQFDARKCNTMWGPFPVRRADMTTHFPFMGEGVYWSPEIHAAQETSVSLIFLRGLRWVPECECDHPFDTMVNEMYAMRLASKGRPAVAMVLKLSINSIYGTLAQVAGAAKIYDDTGAYTYKIPKTQNLFAAGWITSATRAQVYLMAKRDEYNVVGIATDAILTRDTQWLTTRELAPGKPLGQWTYEQSLGRYILVMPGVRFCENEKGNKTRGFRNAPTYTQLAQALQDGQKEFTVVEDRYVTGEMAHRSSDMPWGTFQPFDKVINLTPSVLKGKRGQRHINFEGLTYYLPYTAEHTPSCAPRHLTDTPKTVQKLYSLDAYESLYTIRDGQEYVP